MSRSTEKSSRLLMIRRDLEDIPEFPVPAGFALRWYQPGDEAFWLTIHKLADHYNQITPELFAHQFGTDSSRFKTDKRFWIWSWLIFFMVEACER